MDYDVYGIGEIRMFAGDYDPATWLPCDGSQLAIALYQELFGAIGNRFGGDGLSSFAVPNLPGPAPGVKYIICYEGAFIGSGSSFVGNLAEVRLFAGQALPGSWLPCDGQLLRINLSEYSEALFSLIGTKFGGDGRVTFGIPNLANPIGGAQYMICLEGVYPSAS